MEQDPSSGREKQQTSKQAEDVPTPPNQQNATKAETIRAEAINTKQEELEERLKRGERWMLILTAVMACATVVSAVVGIYQWQVMSGQLAEMKTSSADTKTLAQAAQNQAIAAKESADAAKAQATAAQNATSIAKQAFDENVKTFQQDQRAWIAIKGIRIFDPFEAHKPLTVRATMVNTGKTPAFNTMHLATVAITDQPLNIKKFEKLVKVRPKGGRSTMPPNIDSFLDTTTDENLTDQEVQSIKAGKIHIYYFGTIDYSDAFGRSHRTQFCATYFPSTNDFGLCSEYNYAN
jgi:hypothetical protein